jgi:TRAP transporter 4TM/12TM fusion protein
MTDLVEIGASSKTGEELLVFRFLAVAFPLFFIFLTFYPIPDHISIGVFIWFVWILGLIALPLNRKIQKPRKCVPWYDWILIILATVCCWYYILNYEGLNLSLGKLTSVDRGIIAVSLILTLEVVRRAMGYTLPIIALGGIGVLYWTGFSTDQIMTRLYIGDIGFFGSIADIFARYVLLFFIFGSLMEKAGGTEFLRQLVERLSGKDPSGPAKAAVLGSAALGTIMGSCAGNVAITGALTIPMMKKVGYPPHKAAGIEAVSGLGGEITPPVMGAAVFLLVANTGIPYRDVIIISALPAILYYIPIFLSVHLEAKRFPHWFSSFKDVEVEGGPRRSLFKDFGYLLIPPIVLVSLILIGFSPNYGAACSIFSLVITNQFKKKSRLPIGELIKALIAGSFSFIQMGVTAALLGIIITFVVMSGLANLFVSWATIQLGGNLPLVILIVFLMGLILGMGIPIVGSYMILATVAGQALEALGLPVITAHLLMLWYAETAALTPPVCLAVYVAAGLAGTGINKTAAVAMRLGIALYILPLIMVYRTLVTGEWTQRWIVFGFTAVGLAILAVSNAGYLRGKLSVNIRIALVLLGVLFFLPLLGLNLLALIIASFLLIWRLYFIRPKNQIQA